MCILSARVRNRLSTRTVSLTSRLNWLADTATGKRPDVGNNEGRPNVSNNEIPYLKFQYTHRNDKTLLTNGLTILHTSDRDILTHGLLVPISNTRSGTSPFPIICG